MIYLYTHTSQAFKLRSEHFNIFLMPATFHEFISCFMFIIIPPRGEVKDHVVTYTPVGACSDPPLPHLIITPSIAHHRPLIFQSNFAKTIIF